MLIMTPDGKTVFNLSNIMYLDVYGDNGSCTIYAYTDRQEYNLATYHTEERALEVLDAIIDGYRNERRFIHLPQRGGA